MAENKTALHAHQYAISLETFNKTPGLRDEFIITQKDNTSAGVEFVDYMEHKKYPIFALMYHPEYQLNGLVQAWHNTSDEYEAATDEIAFRYSINFNR